MLLASLSTSETPPGWIKGPPKPHLPPCACCCRQQHPCRHCCCAAPARQRSSRHRCRSPSWTPAPAARTRTVLLCIQCLKQQSHGAKGHMHAFACCAHCCSGNTLPCKLSIRMFPMLHACTYTPARVALRRSRMPQPTPAAWRLRRLRLPRSACSPPARAPAPAAPSARLRTIDAMSDHVLSKSCGH